MKKQGIVGIVMIMLWLPSFIFNINPPVDDVEVGKRGAKTKEDLPDVVFNSIRLNQFDLLLNYLPNDNELLYLGNRTDRKDKYMFEGLSSEQLQANTKLNFEKVVEEGIKNQINWSTVEMTDSRIEVGKSKDDRAYKGFFTVQDGKAESLQISFDIIKVKNKWFLFQGMRVEK